MADLQALLRDLGPDERRVALALHWAGVTGKRQSASLCPVANYVRLFYPEAFDVVVSSDDVCVWEERDDLPKVAARTPTPAAVQRFLASFDAGAHALLRERLVERSDDVAELVPAAPPAEPMVRVRVPI